MTHSASLVTNTPDMQALFDQDWSCGKYRRPKCSKSDFYAGWLIAYERFNAVSTEDKISVVATPAAAAAPVETTTHWTPELSRQWLDGVTFGDPQRDGGHRRIFVGYEDTIWRMSEYNSGEWTIERRNPHATKSYLMWDALEGMQAMPLKVARVVAAREIKGLPMPTPTSTYYHDSAPIKREPNRGLAPNAGTDQGQAIPDAMLRKLAAAAGRPSIAP